MSKIRIPHSDKESEAFLKSVLAGDSTVTVKPMFGNLAAFVNGNMFAGLYGDDFFVRLSEKESNELIKHDGAGPFEPMKGRPMKGYFLIPRAWQKQPDQIRFWIMKARSWTSKMPPKKKKAK